MNNRTIHRVFKILSLEVRKFQEPIVGRVARDHDPFKILISTMLSLRTKDITTERAFERLTAVATTPHEIAGLPLAVIEQAIYPVGFYKTKAKSIKETARIISQEYNGKVPHGMDELLKLPGVGRKTANLVIILGFDALGICVDTHVHRITNRWGYVSTKTPDETEMRLRDILPVEYWKDINNYLVPYGQNVCLPVSPLCSRCAIRELCECVGVKISR